MPLLLMFLSALVMQLRWLDFFGVNPNIFIAMLSSFIFFSDSQYIFFITVFIGILFLKYKFIFEAVSLYLFLIGIFIFLIRRALPVVSVAGVAMISFISTILFYVLKDYHMIISHTQLVFSESFYNAILSIGFYLLFKLIYGEER